MVQTVYTMFPNKRYSGFYQFTTPILLIRDPDLIKQVTVKDFDHFVDHRTFISEDADPLLAKNLFGLTGQKWREMRNTLSPAFTSSKMKYIFSLISRNGEQFVEYFLKKNEDIITVEMKDVCTRFTNDAIANTVFGIECDSLRERNNEFYLMGKEATDFTSFWRLTKFFAYLLAPQLCKIMKVRLFSKKIYNFFTTVVRNNIESREKHGIVRRDMINLLLEARKQALKHEESTNEQNVGSATVHESEVGKNQNNKKRYITDLDITSQALIFFFAGFDTVASLMCFMAYEIGTHPEIQRRLRQEVDDTKEACNGNLTYEALLGMKYMDMVVSETLRKWPTAIGTDRIVTKSYTIKPKYPDEKPIHLKEKDIIFLPAFGLHRDPKYYPDPDSFDPERFSEENKHKIEPYSYIPFGSGPRNCIGSRFAVLETKTLFFYILSHFEVVAVQKTPMPLVLNKKSLNLSAEGGFWLGLKRRVK